MMGNRLPTPHTSSLSRHARRLRDGSRYDAAIGQALDSVQYAIVNLDESEQKRALKDIIEALRAAANIYDTLNNREP